MITLECNYSKKIGLPQYSSHQFSITLRTEIADLRDVKAESNRLYTLLQESVDQSIKEIGYLPENGNGNGHSNGKETWNCSAKQKDLILKIVDDNKLDKNHIEKLAQDRFGKGVRQLNRLEASGLIEELLEKYGDTNKSSRRFQKARA